MEMVEEITRRTASSIGGGKGTRGRHADSAPSRLCTSATRSSTKSNHAAEEESKLEGVEVRQTAPRDFNSLKLLLLRPSAGFPSVGTRPT